MKFDINKERLLRVLLHLKSAVPTYRMASGSVFCYLYRSFIFTAKSDFLRVEATDGEVFVSEEMSRVLCQALCQALSEKFDN